MQLMINPNTVAKAYSELNAEGLVESRQGLGLFVAERRQILSEDERDKRLHKAIDSFINETINLNFSEKEIAEQLKIKMKKLNKSKKGQERK